MTKIKVKGTQTNIKGHERDITGTNVPTTRTKSKLNFDLMAIELKTHLKKPIDDLKMFGLQSIQKR